MTINVYEQYFAAEAVFNGVERRGALVMLISDSEAGTISYKAAVTFFPHRDEEDFAVSYDAYFEKELYHAPGRRSKKREAALLEQLPAEIDALTAAASAVASASADAPAAVTAGIPAARVLWDKPLRDARRG